MHDAAKRIYWVDVDFHGHEHLPRLELDLPEGDSVPLHRANGGAVESVERLLLRGLAVGRNSNTVKTARMPVYDKRRETLGADPPESKHPSGWLRRPGGFSFSAQNSLS